MYLQRNRVGKAHTCPKYKGVIVVALWAYFGFAAVTTRPQHSVEVQAPSLEDNVLNELSDFRLAHAQVGVP